MAGIFAFILIIVCPIMAYVTYKQEQKEKEKRILEEEERIRKQKEKDEKIHNLRNELKNIDAEMDPILNISHSVSKKDKARCEELEERRNKICVELYELTGEETLYKGLCRLPNGLNPLVFEYQKIDDKRSKEKQKQEEKERLIQQQIQEKQRKKAESRAAYLAGWAIANEIHERNKKAQKERQQEKEMKEMKELLKKLNRR